MTHVTCRLTAKQWDQLRNPTLCNREWATFTFYLSLLLISSHLSPLPISSFHNGWGVYGNGSAAAWCFTDVLVLGMAVSLMSNKLLCKLFISYSTASFRTVFLDEEVRQPHTRPISTILHTHPLTAIHSLGHKNIPGLSQDPRSIFPVPCHQPAMFKYRDKQLYYDSSIIRGVYVHHCHWMYYTEQRCADEHILACASTSLPSKFQEFP